MTGSYDHLQDNNNINNTTTDFSDFKNTLILLNSHYLPRRLKKKYLCIAADERDEDRMFMCIKFTIVGIGGR